MAYMLSQEAMHIRTKKVYTDQLFSRFLPLYNKARVGYVSLPKEFWFPKEKKTEIL